MKLIIILSVVACSYAAKLDRTYLPPANAATAGGTPGSLTAPGSGPNLSSGTSAFAQAVEQGFKAQSGPGTQSTKTGFQSASQYQPGASGSQIGQYGQSSPGAEVPAFGQEPNSFSGNQGSFGNQGPQDTTAYSRQYQPERVQAAAERTSDILRYDNQNDGDNFAYSFETSNGITVEESGVATNGVQAQGGYSYTGDDGQQFRVTYTADENGYQPQGEHLPTPHPIPEEILRSLEENARAAAAGTQEGAYRPEEESNFESQQYSNDAPSYQGQAQRSEQVSSAYNQPGQATSSQYRAASASRPGSAQLSASQGYQYQAGSKQGLSQKSPTGPGFSFPSGQAIEDQGSSPSTPTGSNVFAPSGPRQSAQNQGQFGSFSTTQQGQAPGQSGYQYSNPEGSSIFGKTNQPGQFRPEQPAYQSSSSFTPESQGPAYSKPQSFGSTGSSGQAQGPSNQGFGSTQDFNTNGQGNRPNFGSSGSISGPASPAPGSSFSKPNGAQTYTPAGPSTGPSNSQGSTFPRPSTSANNGYVYGPGISSSPIAAKSSGQGFVPSGPSGLRGPSDSFQGSFSRGPIGQVSSSNSGPNFAPQGSQPSRPAQSSPGSSFPRPNGPVGASAGSDQGSFGGASQYQPSAKSQGSASSRPNGSITLKAQGPFGAAPQYQPNQSSPSAQTPLGPAFSRPTGSAVGPNDSSPSSQGPFRAISQSSVTKSLMPNQSAPYQYNRPGSQVSQSGSTQNTAGFITPEDRPGQTFGGPRQPPSFSPEDGYKY